MFTSYLVLLRKIFPLIKAKQYFVTTKRKTLPKNLKFTTLKHCNFMGQYIKSVFDLPSSVSYSMKKMMEVMLVNGLKKPKPLYNVCPKTMLLSILQRTLSIHQVQLLTSLEQTKNSKHTHTHEQKSRKKPCWDNVVLHGPTKQFTTYHP